MKNLQTKPITMQRFHGNHHNHHDGCLAPGKNPQSRQFQHQTPSSAGDKGSPEDNDDAGVEGHR